MIGGGARSIAVSGDNSLYVLSNSNVVKGNSAIWKYSGGVWTQQPGSAAKIVGSLEFNPYSVRGVGTIGANGYFALTSAGAISYYAPGAGYVRLPGTASDIAPIPGGGAFALAHSSSRNGSQLSYFDYVSANWTAERAAGESIAAGPGNGGYGTQLYLIGCGNAIWTTPLVTANPTITEFALPSRSDPIGIASGPGGLWFTEQGLNKIGRITTGGSITEYAIPTLQGGPREIALGPDGAMWFTKPSSSTLPNYDDKIGRITASGKITEYAIARHGYPFGIAAGPDGAMWFTERIGNRIGRIATSGRVTEFALDVGNAPWGITAGPDGALWFTHTGSNTIGRITTGGSVTEYPIPTPNSMPEAIAAGPDGALWFVESNVNRIGRITTRGSITEYAIPHRLPSPASIVAGPDGALWFTEIANNTLGRITTRGIFSQYEIFTAGSAPQDIAASPDGTLWFTESYTDQIGRVRLH
jgi:virginiamycin B lyase